MSTLLRGRDMVHFVKCINDKVIVIYFNIFFSKFPLTIANVKYLTNIILHNIFCENVNLKLLTCN